MLLPKVRNVNTLAAGYTPSSMQDVDSFTQFLQAIYVKLFMTFIYQHCVEQFFFQHGSVNMIAHYDHILYQIEELVKEGQGRTNRDKQCF